MREMAMSRMYERMLITVGFYCDFGGTSREAFKRLAHAAKAGLP